ncbi:MAG: alpha-1,2-fucosyltransferase [Helicobacter apodemus]|nr:alpha-1,2-fucosyltransferase [Helicobacter apodemus]
MQYKIVEFTGGLGNQMFQYAFAKSLEHHLQMPILLDKTWFEKEGHSIPFSLDIFNIDLPYATQEQIQKARAIESKPKLIRSILKRVGFPRVTYVETFAYKEEYLKPNSFAYFRGYFQNPKYFQSCASKIKILFAPPPIKSAVSKHKLQQILQSPNSCFIHIRRGDYVQLSWQLDIEYFKKAVDVIAHKIENPQFFLFCADREFAHNLDLGYPFVDMTSENITRDNHFEDLILMMHCQNGIISNSTYSWWAAYLINNPQKIVIAPTPWLFGNDEIVCEDWIKIKVAGIK